MNREIGQKEYWDRLIVDYFTNSLSAAAVEELTHWLNTSEQNRGYFNELKTAWDSVCLSDDGQYDYEKPYALFLSRIGELNRRKKRHTTKHIVLWRRVATVAAVLLPFLFLSYFTGLYFYDVKMDEKLITSEISAPKGSKTKLKLADGSTLWLNSETTIRYNVGFGKENRRLELVGEAYLEVARNEKTPFIVDVNGAEVEVLGTSFNVKAYPENDNIRVSLFNGSVSLMGTDSEASIILSPMETAIYNRKTGEFLIRQETNDRAHSWRSNRLVFSGESLFEIAKTLERHFDVNIKIHDQKVGEKQFIGDFEHGESLDKILRVMTANKKFSYKMKEREINIY